MKIQSKNRRIYIKKYLLLMMSFCLLASCGQPNENSDTPSNQTAIAAIVQTVNANATPTAIPKPISSATTTIVVSPTANTNMTSVSTLPAFDGESFDKSIQFSGLEWKVKFSSQPVGPGPNYFSNSNENVWVDESGQLHLKITHRDNKWYCAEIVSAEPLGYGSYQFKLASKAASINKNAVLGLFTWDTTAPQFNYREVDIEISSWGEDGGRNAQFVVQPWNHSGNRHRFMLDPQLEMSTHRFIWTPDSVQFLSFRGDALSPLPNDIIEHWTYTGKDIPPADSGNARINLWLFKQPPSDEKEIEVVLSSFQFIPQTITK